MSTPPADQPRANQLRRQVSAGVRWSIVDQVAQQVARVVLTALLTRLTSPRDYGLIALAFLFTSIASFVTDLGMGTALVQRPVVERAHERTAVTSTLVVGVGLALLVALTAPVTSSWFHQPRLAPVLVVCSLNFPLKGLASIPRFLLQRHFRLADTAVSNVGAAVGSGTAAVVVAVLGGGVWALVVYSVGESLLSLVLTTVLASRAGVYRPSIGYDRQAFKDIAGFGAYVTGLKMAYYVQMNTDNLLVGRVLGATPLAFYSLAYRIMLLPIQKLGEVATNVALPAFSQLQAEPQRLRAAFERGLTAVTTGCLPLSIGACITAPVLVPVVFGPHWTPAVAPLQILSLSGPRLATTRLNGVAFQAAGRPSWDFRITMTGAVLYVLGFVIGVRYGVNGVAWGFTITGYVVAVPAYLLVARVVHTTAMRLLTSLWPTATATALMALVVEVVRRAAVTSPSPGGLLLLVAVGAVVYAGVMLACGRQHLHQLRADLLSR